MLFVSTIYTNQQTICYSLQTMQIVHHTLIISKNYFTCKRKRYNSTLNLTLTTVIIYTGNKVKSSRGKKREKASTKFFSFGQQIISVKISCI